MKWSPPAWFILGMAATALLIALCGCSARPNGAVIVYRCPRGVDNSQTTHQIDVWQTPNGRLYFQDHEISPIDGAEFIPLAPGTPPTAACIDVH